MRKYIVSILITSSLVCFGPAVSSAGDWETYLEVGDRYYYLDDKEFTSITCAVDIPSLSNALQKVKEQMRSVRNNISFEENLQDFRLTFNPVKGLSIVKPKVEAKVITTEGMRDPEQVQRGVDMMNNAYNLSIDGSVQVLDSIFEIYQKPDKNKTDLLSISGNKDPIEVRYKQDGITALAIIDGADVRETGHNDNFEVKSDTKFIKINNKYLADEIKAQISQSSMQTDMEMKLEYQDVGGIVFPKKISAKIHAVTDNVTQDGTMEIFLTGCEMK